MSCAFVGSPLAFSHCWLNSSAWTSTLTPSFANASLISGANRASAGFSEA